ncbi:hypothetical protein Amal_03607 [Acetobacter malorum]|uniref:Uncharacterized protein n=1 Tax=Acetobacter malorum TaxID=178901 RepID=A0A177G601_9PROT|nr:hypothetical protein Amal_03607 [Acetobacter malorum]
MLCVPGLTARHYTIPTGFVTCDGGNRGVFVQRRVKRINKAFDVVDNFLLNHEAVRIFSLVRMAREFALPVRCNQAEIVPALIVP